MQTIDFKGQSVIVTGAGGGIGRGVALLLGQRGARVLVNDYGGSAFGEGASGERAEAVAREIRAAGGEAVADATAVGSAAAARQICDAALRAFGRIDALMNNAGIVQFGGVAECSDAELDRVIETNFLGAFRLLRAVWPVMKQQGYGRILNVASNSAIGFGGMTAYAASKSGLMGLTGDCSREGQPLGILVNSLLPAAFTRMSDAHPDASAALMAGFNEWLRTNFNPEKISPTAVYLLSKECTVCGEHFSTGAGRVSRIAHLATDGFHDAALTPELVAANFELIRDTTRGHVVTSGMEELQGYMGVAPYAAS